MKLILTISTFILLVSCAPSPRYSTLQGGGSGKNKVTSKSDQNKSKKISGHHDMRGEASWYGPGFQGKKTANGEKFNKHDMTAAHKTLPFNTVVEVTEIESGKKVKVRINDRGPYAKGRIIDLSEKAAKRLGIDKKGHSMVKLRIIK